MPDMTDEELVKAAKEAGIPVPPSLALRVGSGAKASQGEISAAVDGTGEKLSKFLTQNLPMGLAVGGVLAGTGGGGLLPAAGASLLPAAGAGIMSMLMPPQDAGDAMTLGAGVMAEPALGAASQMKNPIARLLSRMGIGAGVEATRALPALGGGADMPSPLSLAGAAALPALGGRMTDPASAANEKNVIQGHVQKVMDEIHGTPQQLGPDALPTGVTPEVKAVHSDLQTQFQQARANAQQQQIVQKQLGVAKATRDKVALQFDGPQDPKEMITATTKYSKLATASLESSPDFEARGQIANLQGALKNIPDVKTPQGQAQVDAINAQIQHIQDQSLQQRVADLRKSSEQHLGNMYADGTKRVVDLQHTLDGLQKEISTNPLENTRLMALVSPDPAKPTTPETFFANLVKGTADDVKALYTHLDDMPNGKAQIEGVRKGLINEFVAKAYDPKSGRLSNANALLKGDGPFNKDKIEAMFGGEKEGREAGRQFTQVIDDARRLTELNPDAASTTSPMKQALGGMVKNVAFVTPTALLLHSAGWHIGTSIATAEAAAGLGKLVAVPWSKLIDSTVTNPGLAKAFHEWAVSGGQAPMNQTLVNWVKANGPEL